MARKRSEWLSAFFKTGEVVKGLVDAFLQAGKDPDELLDMMRTDSVCRQEAASAVLAYAKEKKEDAILHLVSSTAVYLSEGGFIARDHFKVDMSDEAEVRINYLGNEFVDNFLPMVEVYQGGEGKLDIHQLSKSSRDIPIIIELGEERIARIPLVCLWEMLKKQGKGEKGELFTDGSANIFFIRDAKNTLWTVDMRWGAAWNVYTEPIGVPGEWSKGDRVFSRSLETMAT